MGRPGAKTPERLGEQPTLAFNLTPLAVIRLCADMPHPPACLVCGHPVFDPKNHDLPAVKAVKMFEAFRCKCGKPARVRCFNGIGTYWIECEDGHGMGRPA